MCKDIFLYDFKMCEKVYNCIEINLRTAKLNKLSKITKIKGKHKILIQPLCIR